MHIRVLIIEDEVLVAEDISSDLEAYGFEVIGVAISSEECWQILENKQPHVILMDVKIKGSEDGIQLAEKINTLLRVPIIYLTANSDQQTIKRAFKTRPQAFITKPYSKKDLIIAIDLAFEKYNETILDASEPPVESVFVRSGNYFEKVELAEVAYIKASGSYTEIILSEDKQYTLSKNLLHFQKEVRHPDFLKVHRSYIVNMSRVDAFGSDTIRIGRHEIPVSRQYAESLKRFKKI